MPASLTTIVRSYLRAIETGDLEGVLACYAPGAVQVEWPNRLKSKGDRRGLEEMARDFSRGKALLSSQSYEILNEAEGTSYVVVELLWKGVLAVPVGKLAAGAEMISHSAVAFNFEDGLIVSQRNYDCFEEF
jgi:ketosteroid isomerase-like protein